MNIFHHRFSTGQVVQATGVTNATLQTWLKRGLIVGQKDGDRKAEVEGGGSPGAYRSFSFYNVMEIAVAKALVDLGLSVSDAMPAAMRFAHTGHGPILDEPGRSPGLPFDPRGRTGWTVLCVAGEHRIVEFWSPGTDHLAAIRHRLHRPDGFILLQIDPIFERVTHALGYDDRDVLAVAYPTHAAANEPA